VAHFRASRWRDSTANGPHYVKTGKESARKLKPAPKEPSDVPPENVTEGPPYLRRCPICKAPFELEHTGDAHHILVWFCGRRVIVSKGTGITPVVDIRVPCGNYFEIGK
jgi:hypothetical protein